MLRWALRRPRAWVAALAWLVAVGLSVSDGRPGWTAFVALWTGSLLAVFLRGSYYAAHPNAAAQLAERARAKEQAQVDEIVRRYEARKAGRPPPEQPSRRDRKRQERVDAILWRYERQRAARDRDRTRH